MLRPGQIVALCVLALLTIGVVMVNSAGMVVDTHKALSIQSILLSRSTVYAALAMGALFACAMLPIRRLLPAAVRGEEAAVPPGEADSPRSRVLTTAWFRELMREYIAMWPLWVGALGLIAVIALVYVPGVERPRNGSHRWISLRLPGLESIQPSEIAKWGLIVLVAWFGARYARRMKSFWFGFAPGLAAAGAVAAAIVLEDLGTGALVAAVAGIMLLGAGGRLWQLMILLPIPVAGAVLAIVTSEYRMHRIESFLNPFLDPKGKGFHMIQSMLAVANGEVFGRGLGGGLQKFEYLPEDTTDFIFAIICEELGVAGAALVLALFAGLLWGVWTITRRERLPMLKLIGLGVMATIGIQALINLAVVTGLGPTKGIALPLLSSGGTGWILTAAAVGLIIAMDRAQAFETGGETFGITDEPTPDEPMPSTPGLTLGFVGGDQGLPVLAEYKPAPAPHSRHDAGDARIAQAPEQRVENAANVEDAAMTRFAPMTASSASAQTVGVIPGAPGETGLLFALNEPAPMHSPTPAPASAVQAQEESTSGPEISGTAMASAVTGVEHVHTDVVLSDEAPTTPVAPQVVITDDGREWPEQSARLGMA